MLAAVLLAIGAGFGAYRLWVHPQAVTPEPNVATESGYVDGTTCRGCHSDVWETYRHTGMGRSFTSARAETMPPAFNTGATFYHPASDRHYRMYQKDGKYYVRRHQTGFNGGETNVVEKRVDFIVGSGNHARTLLHRTPDGRIFELPVAWYSENGGYWAMNPGYDRANHYDFSREITHECLFCHNAYPEIAPGSDRVGSEPRFAGRMPEGIDCQRCHGPGRRHIEAAQTGNKELIREAILNPKRLTPERQLELCMQCHLETTSARLPHAILRFDRGAFSYRPGEPLADYVLHFDHAPGSAFDDKFEIAHHAYRLRKSSCFQDSGGRLNCTTCHNPHKAPRDKAAVETYSQACRGCHAASLVKLVAAKRHTDATNCVDCHMPKRRTEDVIHVVMTDHYIQRKPRGNLLAPLKEREETGDRDYRGPVVPYYPPKLPPTPESELYVALAQVKQLTNLKEGIASLAAALDKHRPEEGQFYFELAEAYASVGKAKEAIRMYEEAVRRKPDFRPALLGLSKTLSKSGDHARAEQLLVNTLKSAPRDPAILNDLGLVHLRRGNLTDAVAAFRRAVESDPDHAEAYNNLGGVLSQTGDKTGAEEAYRRAIRVQPDFSGAHRNLANLLAERGDIRQAEHHFRKAIYHQPDDALAHFDFGTALAASDRYEQARAEFEAAVRIDPKLAEAHVGVADMLAMQGNVARSIPHYQQALAMDPDSGPAHLGLGSALAAQARRSEALAHLERASRSSDPAIRQAAEEALKTMR